MKAITDQIQGMLIPHFSGNAQIQWGFLPRQCAFINAINSNGNQMQNITE